MMRRFTLFSLLYLAAGICLTAIAFHSPDIASRPKTGLLLNAGLLYICAVLSTFSFWHQRLSSRRRDLPTWRQKLSTIAPWLTLALVLVGLIFNVPQHWTSAAIAQASPSIILALLCIEWIFARKQAMR
jgi:L-asparagine transporter-like permease